MAAITMNLYRDFADGVRHEISSGGYDVSSIKDDDEAALRLYSKLSRCLIVPIPRKVLKARDFDPLNYEDAIAVLEDAIGSGENLSPYMTRTITDASFHDSMLDHWGIYHFHLGSEMEEDGHFIRRTPDILLCRFDDDYAYFMTIQPHGRNVPAPWFQKSLIEIVHENWPESIRHALAIGLSGISPGLDDQEVAEIRKKTNLVLPLQMSDGTIYMPPGIGNTLGLVTGDGSNVNDIRAADRIWRLTEQVEEKITRDFPRITESARHLGFHLREPVSFRLAKTRTDVYWDILEPNTQFRFRVWVNDLFKPDSSRMAP